MCSSDLLGILPLTVVFVALGERAMFAPWWIWAIVAASCLALTLLLRVVRRRMAAVSAERS